VLPESEARYQRLVARMSALVFELAPDGAMLFVNDAAMSITGYRPDEMQGRNWLDLVVPEDERGALQDLLGRFRLGDVTGHELKLKAKDGSLVWLELDSANRYAADGTLQGIVGFGIDCTRRKRTEQEKNRALRDLGERVRELTASEIRFRTLAETTSAAIFIVEGLRILYANDAARGVTGYARDELLTMELWQLAHPIYQDIVRQNALQPPWGGAIPNRFELRVITKGGEDHWWDVTTAASSTTANWLLS